MARPRNPEAKGLSLARKMPRKETEVMRQMRASYLAAGKNRSYRKIAEQYGYSADWVSAVARAFHWVEDAKARDMALDNAFVEENQPQINRAQRLMFASMLHDIEVEALKRGITIDENGVLVKLNQEGLDAALKELEKDQITNGGLRLQNYQDVNSMLNALRKVVYEWNPETKVMSGGGTLLSGKGTTVENMNVMLVIEK